MEYTLDELVSLYLPNVVYAKDNEDHRQKLSDILIAYLNSTFNINIVGDKWILERI